MGTVRFSLRVDKKLNSGKAPIELVYQVQGQRKYYNTGLKVFSESWDAKAQRVVFVDKRQAKLILPAVPYNVLPLNTEVQELNVGLTDLKKDIEIIEKRFVMDKIPYSSQMVIDKLKEGRGGTTKKEASSRVLFDFMESYIQDHKTTREKGSLTVYKSVKKHLQEYQQATKRKITFDNIDYSVFQSFQNFLTDSKKLNNTTVAKQLSTLKTFLNYARAQGIEVSLKYKDFKIKRDTLEVIALTNEEFEALLNHNLSQNKRLAQVRDVFCFACSTGLRYSDLAQLKREHIKEDEIRLIVKKTKQPLTIPLTSYSRAILAKYKDQYRPLPVISNQKMNDYIKELAELAKINEPVEIVRFRGIKREAITYPKFELIGVHTGRKTFATLSLERGMSAEAVMTITGHKDYKSFKRYVKVTEQHKKTVMLKAWQRADNK